MSVGGLGGIRCGGGFGPLANERGQRFKHRLMVLVRIVHYAFERIDAAKPDDDVFSASQLLEALRNLIADQEIVRRLAAVARTAEDVAAVQKLQIRHAGAEQDHDTAERLPDRLPKLSSTSARAFASRIFSASRAASRFGNRHHNHQIAIASSSAARTASPMVIRDAGMASQ